MRCGAALLVGTLVCGVAPGAAAAPAGAERFEDGPKWSRCAPDIDPCIRPRPARVLLLSLGALAGGAAAGILFVLGDRLAPSDPGTVLVGTGAIAGAGALVGMVAGRLRGDDPAAPDRIRPATTDLAYRLTAPTHLDERTSHTMVVRIAPTWSFADGNSRVRLLGHFGGWLAPLQQVDPRPQLATTVPGQQGNAPVGLRQRRMTGGIGLDWAVRLPYPLLAAHRSAFLGPSEIRWKPDVQFRRDVIDPGTASEHAVGRTMLLPLTIGMRWHVSQRQRFTFYLGPRFDYVSVQAAGGSVARGKAQLGPLYGEAWYDLDVPLTSGPRRDGKARATVTTGQLTLGYQHTRFDGNGFNVGPVVGFLGAVHAQWHTRVRPVGSPFAFQATAAVAVGNGITTTLAAGIVTPNLSRGVLRKKRGRR